MKELNQFNAHQEWCASFWTDKKQEYTLRDDFIMCTGLPGETGEVLELLKKAERDNNNIKSVSKTKLTKELGDVLYYLNVIAHRHGIPMSKIVDTNVRKLTARRAKKKKRSNK